MKEGVLLLIGLPKVGKTTFGKALAGELELPFFDVDQEIEREYQKQNNCIRSVREICKAEGEAFFRSCEKAALKNLDICSAVIATGGGTVLDLENRLLLKKMGRVIYLKTYLEIIYPRVMKTGLPTYLHAENPWESFEKLCKQRMQIYEKLADYCLNMDNRKIPSLLDEIRQWLATHLE